MAQASRLLRRRSAPFAALLLMLALACAIGEPPAEPLRNVGEVSRLSDRWAAAGLRVQLEGVVTLLDPNWALLAIQDPTGGILVDAGTRPAQLQLGDTVRVTGATSLDNHVPAVVATDVTVAKSQPPPTPEPVAPEALACGEKLYRLVEVEIRPDEGGLGDGNHTARFAVKEPCGELVVIGKIFRRHSPASLVGRRIRVRGVPLPSYSPAGRIDAVRLLFEDDASVDVLETTESTPVAPAAGLDVLTSARAVKMLTREEADRGYPVRAEGVVTALNARHDGYFLQDGTVAVFVFASSAGTDVPRPGERVRVSGRTERGGYAPVVRQRSLERLGAAPLPTPVRLVPGDRFQGWEENLWVELEAVPTAVVTEGQATQLEIVSGSRRLIVWFAEGASPDSLRPLLNATVSVRGVYSPLYTASGSLTGFRLFTTSPRLLTVKRPPQPSEQRTIESLVRFDVRGVPRYRIRTVGSVSYRDSRGRVYLQDGDVPLRVLAGRPGDPPLNARAEVEGFVVSDGGTLVLDHARWLAARPGPPVAPVRSVAESMLTGELDGRLIEVEAYVESRRTSAGELRVGLQVGRSRFDALLEAPGSARSLPEVRPGALLRLTGICETRPEPGAATTRLATLRPRTADDLVLVRAAPWWDVRRALYAASAVSLLLVLALGAAVRLRQSLVRQIALRSRLEGQLLHSQRLESVGRLAGGIAHDFNNYLTVILGHSDLLLRRFAEDPEARGRLEAIRTVGRKAAALTRQLLAFSRKQVLRPVPCDLNRMVTDARATLLPLIGEQIEIVTRLESRAQANIDPDQFFQVLVNLAVNARDAMPDGGTLTLETADVDRPRDAQRDSGAPAERRVRFSITDTGIGMDEATRVRIFDPFFTTKERGQGTGLGLAVVFGIVRQSNGQIEVESRPGQGTAFHVYLPVATGPARDAEMAPPAGETRGGQTILVVEDQDQVRDLIRVGLEAHGFRVLEASRPAEALRRLDDSVTAVDLLLTDIAMPGMSGLALAKEATARRPGLRVLYTSGYWEEAVAATAPRGESDYLRKPFTVQELMAAVRRALEQAAS